MQSYSIAMTGLDATQKALEIIGNNIANAATEGYHRQRIELAPAYASQTGTVILGGGVNVVGITQMIDRLLEKEILSQQSSLTQVSQELITMSTVENVLGGLSSDNSLGATIDAFFHALQDLCAHPSEKIWQTQAVTAAETMTSQFRTLGEFLERLETQIRWDAEKTVENINTLINQIAKLNANIERMELTGGQANNLRDQRDQLIVELSGLIGLETQDREYGVVDVIVAGIPVVVGTAVSELEVGMDANALLGLSLAGAHNYNTNAPGGRLGALLTLKNKLVSDVHNDLDALASTIVQQINQYHVQGVGSEGSFTELIGWRMPSENLADFDPPVSDGKIHIRLTNTSTGAITRHEIDIDASSDTLTSIAADISAITGLTASVASSKLRIQADANYKFDFLPAVLPEPTTSNLTGASPPAVSVSGIYTGTENQTFQFTVVGTGSVGNGNLQLEVKNGASEIIATLNVGVGYAAGDKLEIGNGIKISLTTGDLNANDTFEVDAFASTDTSGVLAAVGINTFFSGTSATNITICPDVTGSSGRLATALGPEQTDNAGVLRLAGLKDQALSSLSAMTPGEFYRRIVTDLGQEVSLEQMREDNIEIVVQNLISKQNDMSGVNINDEAAQMLIYEQMFQAMAKYLSTVQLSVSTLIEMV